MADDYRPPGKSPAGPIRPLTTQQGRIACAIGRGLSYKQIGNELNLSPATVKQYVYEMAQLFEDDTLPPRYRVFVWVKWHEWQDRRAS